MGIPSRTMWRYHHRWSFVDGPILVAPRCRRIRRCGYTRPETGTRRLERRRCPLQLLHRNHERKQWNNVSTLYIIFDMNNYQNVAEAFECFDDYLCVLAAKLKKPSTNCPSNTWDTSRLTIPTKAKTTNVVWPENTRLLLFTISRPVSVSSTFTLSFHARGINYSSYLAFRVSLISMIIISSSTLAHDLISLTW